MNDQPQLFNVFAISMADRSERFMDGPMTDDDAEAYIRMAVLRRGVEEEFFTKRPAEPAAPAGGGADHA